MTHHNDPQGIAEIAGIICLCCSYFCEKMLSVYIPRHNVPHELASVLCENGTVSHVEGGQSS